MPRKSLDGVKLAADITRLSAADKAKPPSARPSLMDAVREFAGFIETRTTLGWTDRMIAAVLTEAGYAIDAATLRSYRKRLGDEGRIQPRAKRPSTRTSPSAPPTGALQPKALAEVPAAATPSPAMPKPPEKTSQPDTAPPAQSPPDAASPKRPRFPINQKIMPSNEA